MPPETVLAGPVLRRVERSRVCVWVATRDPLPVRAEVYRLGEGEPLRIGSGEAASVRLGDRCLVHLAEVRPDAGVFPAGELLGYDLQIGGERLSARRILDALTYGPHPLPTFHLPVEGSELRLLHGSCRLPHGKGDDAFLAADEAIARDATEPTHRPSALFLTGDQIYGDEVAGALIRHLTRLGVELIGPEDVPGMPPLGDIPVYGRERFATEHAGFTSGNAENHLMGLGEFVAMYVVAWNEALWPAVFPPPEEAVPDGAGSRLAVARLRWKYKGEVRALERTRRALPSVRRVLANTPTYMCFDDHDVTDDYHLSGSWRERVRASRSGRHIVGNALTAFWAFQGWGNEPELYDRAFIEALTGDDAEREHACWSFDRWSFVAPTDPPTVVLDTRTQRDYDSAEGAAHLVGSAERARITELVGEAGPGRPLLLVSPVPVFGLELQERRQKFLVGRLGPYEIDFEAWHSNLQGLVAFLRLLAEDLELTSCVILSGDVHYGMNVRARFQVGRRTVEVAQLVSSSFKHGGVVSKVALGLLGRVVGVRHERVGWDEPPRVDGREGLKQRLLSRAANTDAWTPDSPVFLTPHRAGQLDVEKPPDYRELRCYVRPHGGGSVLIGENNVGLVRVRGGRVEHHLLGWRRGRTHTHRATMELPVGADDQRGVPAGGSEPRWR